MIVFIRLYIKSNLGTLKFVNNIPFMNSYRANSTDYFQMHVATMDKTIQILKTYVTTLIKN